MPASGVARAAALEPGLRVGRTGERSASHPSAIGPSEHAVNSPDDPNYSLTEAAAACGVGRSTIRRRLDASVFPTAFRLDGPDGPGSGEWRIPLSDLRAAGLIGEQSEPVREQAHDISADEVEHLRCELAIEVERREGLEALLAERERVVETQALALRAFGVGDRGEAAATTVEQPAAGDPPAVSAGGEAAAPPPAVEVTDVDVPADTGEQPRRGRWRRLRDAFTERPPRPGM